MVQHPVVQLFYNPGCGGYSSARIDRLAAALVEQGAQVLRTPSSDRVPQLAADATHVCIAGGDGTIRHVAQMLARQGSDLPVGIYPAGTVNLLARERGGSLAPRALARRLLHEPQPCAHYLADMGDHMFLACASVGPDARAVARVSCALKRRIGRAAYAIAMFGLLWRWPRATLRLQADGVALECEAVYIAKGRFFAGPWSFAPAARVSDGLLHVLALKRARRRDFAVLAMDLVLGRDPSARKNATAFTCTRLDIDCDEPLPLQADGDIVGHCPMRLAIHGQPLTFH